MRTRSILRIAIGISVSIYSTSSVEVAIGRRRSRRVIRHGSALPEPSNKHSNGEYAHEIPRSLGVGLDNLKYGSKGGQYHIEETRGKSGKGNGKGNYYSDDFRGKGKGYVPSDGKGSGKGYNDSGSIDSEDIPRPSPTKPPFPTPTMSPKSGKPTNHVSSKGGKQTKSEKASPTYKPISQPTRLPTSNSKFTTNFRMTILQITQHSVICCFLHLLHRTNSITLQRVDGQVKQATFF
jgi:hypothetical protein